MEDKNSDNVPKETGNTATNSGVEEAATSTSDRLGSMTLLSADAESTPANPRPGTGDSAESDKCCASCGKAGPDGLKRCRACKSVWYCGVNCQIDHRKSHKKECKRIKMELEAQEKQEGEEEKDGKGGTKKEEKFSLWNPMPRPECPICMVVVPLNPEMQKYLSCCGKIICGGCIYAHQRVIKNRAEEAVFTCPFCRQSAPDSGEKGVEKIVARVKSGDARAIHELALVYEEGNYGIPVDEVKALELFKRAANLGSSSANYRLGQMHYTG